MCYFFGHDIPNEYRHLINMNGAFPFIQELISSDLDVNKYGVIKHL